MFTIYHSNQLELLKTVTAELIKREPLHDAFAPELVLVQSNGMAQWLQMALAQELDIAANIQFLFPSRFIWQLYADLLADVPQENGFAKELLSWKLMAILPEVLTQPQFAALKRYLQQETSQRKCYQLAIRLADLYEQYLIYRPEWIAAWEREELVPELGADQVWQAALWRCLLNYTEQLGEPCLHRANIYQRFLDLLSQPNLPTAIKQQLPQRLFIFGIASLPPVYLQSLYALGQHIDVHLMFTNPCRWYWGDIPDQRWLNRLLQIQWQHYLENTSRSVVKSSLNQFDFFAPAIQTHPLLASWGKLGRDNLFLLQEFAERHDIEAFVDIGSESLLQQLQQQMLDLEDATVVAFDEKSYQTSRAKQRIKRQDVSLTFHVCHSEVREVEILHDYLLSMLDRQPDLALRDIVVMVADIDRYAPYIEAIFGHADSDCYLPYTISDQKMRTVDPLIQAFFTVLNLTQSRFTTEELFELLEVPAIAETFAITEQEIVQLRRWVVEAGIRWGLDDEMVEHFSLPVTGQHTWQFGLTRMLLGYVMNSQSGSWQEIVPFDDASGLAAVLVGKLADFLKVLTDWYQQLQQVWTLSEWRDLGSEILHKLYLHNSNSEPLIALLDKHWQAIIDKGLRAGYQQPLSITVLHDALQSSLELNRIEQRFLAGKINFCTMMPMRSIPFKVVCLLGMNDGIYPRNTIPLGFDLLAQQTQKGDRSRRDDDRYLFLEALLSAQQQLYISYIGHAIDDNGERYPSVLVDELRRYIAQSFVLEGDEKRNLDESGEALLDHLTITHSRMPFSPQNFVTSDAQYRVKSYAAQWLPAAQASGRTQHFVEPLPPYPQTTITLDELKQFYRHPVRTLLQKRLNIHYQQYDEYLPETEPFELNALERYQLNQQILDKLVNQEQVEPLFQQLRAAGKLPYGAFGELALAEQQQEMHELAEQIMQQRQATDIVEINLNLQSFTVQGWIHDLQADGVLRWRPAVLTIKDGMNLWIDYLVYCASHDAADCRFRMLGRKQSQWCFTGMDQCTAQQQLLKLLQAYQQGLQVPLLFPLKTAWSWLEQSYDAKTNQIQQDVTILNKARQKLLHSWQGNSHSVGECDDYYLRLFPSLEEAEQQQIIQAAQEFLLPLKQYQLRGETASD